MKIKEVQKGSKMLEKINKLCIPDGGVLTPGKLEIVLMDGDTKLINPKGKCLILSNYEKVFECDNVILFKSKTSNKIVKVQYKSLNNRDYTIISLARLIIDV